MNGLVKVLDENLEYQIHSLEGDTFYLTVSSTRHEVSYPFCGMTTTRVHSVYKKSFQDLPIQDKKLLSFRNYSA